MYFVVLRCVFGKIIMRKKKVERKKGVGHTRILFYYYHYYYNITSLK